MNILVIEDEPLIRRGLLKLLHTIQVEALSPIQLPRSISLKMRFLTWKKNKYEIIFTDIEGGEMSGLDLINGWRERQQYAQWVIVSGFDRFEFAQQAILYGVKEYLLKPVTKQKLAATISRCIGDLKELQVDFIRANQIEELLLELEHSIWEIDRKKVLQQFTQWHNQLEEKSFSLNYYCDILTHILEMLFQRIRNKGSQLLRAFQWEIQTDSQREANEQFLQKCVQMIEMIEQKRKGNEIDPIEMAKNYICHHIDQDISLDEVAHKLGLNPSYFSQLFKKETGETFVKYRIRLRMERAKELLLQKDVKVIDIPFLIGLNDHPHFTKTFKKYTGQTPSSFRRKMGVD